MNTEIYKKLSDARNIIKSSQLKKAGHNTYSGYDYFTPEQINALVHHAERETGLLHLFGLEREELGMIGRLLIVDIETGETITFIQATDIPQIKATNISQQIGGAVTYTLRYMLMTAFDIADNSLDFDAKDNREAQPEKKLQAKNEKMAISETAFGKLCEKLKANPTPADQANLLSKARNYYLPFTEEQENIISQIIDD